MRNDAVQESPGGEDHPQHGAGLHFPGEDVGQGGDVAAEPHFRGKIPGREQATPDVGCHGARLSGSALDDVSSACGELLPSAAGGERHGCPLREMDI